MSAARPLRRRSAPPRGDSPQGEGGVMSAARPLRRRSALQAALALAGARPLAGTVHAAGHAPCPARAPSGDSPQGEGGVMPAAQPLRMHPDLREAT
jgi:hypothetical protein